MKSVRFQDTCYNFFLCPQTVGNQCPQPIPEGTPGNLMRQLGRGSGAGGGCCECESQLFIRLQSKSNCKPDQLVLFITSRNSGRLLLPLPHLPFIWDNLKRKPKRIWQRWAQMMLLVDDWAHSLSQGHVPRLSKWISNILEAAPPSDCRCFAKRDHHFYLY